MEERDERTATPQSWDEALEDAMSFYAGDETLARRSVERKIGPRPLPEDVEAVRRRLLEDSALQPASDERRGRAFLERLGRATETSDRDAYLAGAALFDLLEMHEPVGEIEGHEVVALGRVLRGSE